MIIRCLSKIKDKIYKTIVKPVCTGLNAGQLRKNSVLPRFSKGQGAI